MDSNHYVRPFERSNIHACNATMQIWHGIAICVKGVSERVTWRVAQSLQHAALLMFIVLHYCSIQYPLVIWC
jgi:hypothetical protein